MSPGFGRVRVLLKFVLGRDLRLTEWLLLRVVIPRFLRRTYHLQVARVLKP